MKRIKGHHIAKIILYIPMMLLFYVTSTFIRDPNPNPNHIYPTPTGDVVYDTLNVWGYHYADFIMNLNDTILWFYVLLVPAFIVFILDIIGGVGRSRFQEREERRTKAKYKEAANKLKEIAKNRYVPMFIEELDIGDVIRTDTDGEHAIEKIHLDENAVTLENGQCYYPSLNNTFKYVY